MLLDLDSCLQKHSLSIRGAIHVGAHWGEEFCDYQNCGIQNMIFFEPTKASFDVLAKRLSGESVVLVNKAVGNANTNIEMFIESVNNGQSNSILEPSRHLEDYPNIEFKGREVVEMVRLDDYIGYSENYNFLNIDVQGYELEVLKGAAETLNGIDAILTEVNFDQLYKGGALIEELDSFLNKYLFQRVETKWWKKSCWGDALYIRSDKD